MNDPDTRAIYDETGMSGLSDARGGSGGGPGMDPTEFFAQFFAGQEAANMFGFEYGGDGPSHRRRKAQDSVLPYEVTLEDLYNGKTVKLSMEKDVTCDVCKG